MLSVAAAIVLKSRSMWNQDPSTQHVCSAYQAQIRFRIWLNNQILKDLDVGLWQRLLQTKDLALNTDQMNHDCSRYFEYKYFGQKTGTSCSGPWNTWSTGPSFSLHQELKVSKDFFSWNGWVQIPPSGWLIENENPPVWDTPNTYVVGSSHVFPCFSFWSCCFYLNIKSLGYTPIVVMLGMYIEQSHTTLPETPFWPTWPTTLDRGPSDSQEHDFDQQDGKNHGWLFS